MTNEEAKSRTDSGMQLVLGIEVPQNIPLGLALIQSAAEADYDRGRFVGPTVMLQLGRFG